MQPQTYDTVVPLVGNFSEIPESDAQLFSASLSSVLMFPPERKSLSKGFGDASDLLSDPNALRKTILITAKPYDEVDKTNATRPIEEGEKSATFILDLQNMRSPKIKTTHGIVSVLFYDRIIYDETSKRRDDGEIKGLLMATIAYALYGKTYNYLSLTPERIMDMRESPTEQLKLEIASYGAAIDFIGRVLSGTAHKPSRCLRITLSVLFLKKTE